MFSAINITWGQRDAHGWTCPCGERLSIRATPDTQPYRVFSQSSQGSLPSQQQSKGSSLPLEDPSSPRSGASEPLALSPSPTVLHTCMGALPLGVPIPIALRGRYPLMRHSREKVHWIYVDRVGCFSRDPPCKAEAKVNDNGHLMPCTPCEELPRDPTMCKWIPGPNSKYPQSPPPPPHMAEGGHALRPRQRILESAVRSSRILRTQVQIHTQRPQHAKKF